MPGPDKRPPHVVTYGASAVHDKLATLTYCTLDACASVRSADAAGNTSPFRWARLVVR